MVSKMMSFWRHFYRVLGYCFTHFWGPGSTIFGAQPCFQEKGTRLKHQAVELW